MNKKYELLNESLKALKKGAINLLILRGEVGFGKSYSTIKFLKDNKINFAQINNYATALEFYNLLYKNREKEVVVIDDTHNVGDAKILSMLKSACWSVLGKSREIGYHTTAKIFDDLKLPSTFKFKSRIVLIMNEIIPNFQPIIDRGVKIDFNFTFKEKIEIFKDIQEKAEIDTKILEYVTKNCNEANKDLSIRSLVTLSNLKTSGFKWQDFAKEIFKINEDKNLLLQKVSKYHHLRDAQRKWSEETGLGRATFFRYYKQMGGKALKNDIQTKQNIQTSTRQLSTTKLPSKLSKKP